MRFSSTPLGGVVVVDLDRHADDRGGFARSFCEVEFAAHGLPTHFPQCNLSFNRAAGTLRGMHFNIEPHGEAKLVRCVRGSIHDVVVDLRDGSDTRFNWFGVDLTAANGRALFVPAGFAHGFVTLADDTDVHYHMSEIYRPDAARGLRWDDPAFAIEWPVEPTLMSDADASYPDIDLDTFDLTSAPIETTRFA
jgi:dTDP-4-dehydrorhamnose 3,5-epimerase